MEDNEYMTPTPAPEQNAAQTHDVPVGKVLLRAENLTKKYGGGTPALDDVSLEIPSGKIIGLLGPNGSGKTTFLKLAAGLLTPTAGKIRIDGSPVGPGTKSLVAYLPERNSIPEHFRVRDAVAYYADFFSDFSTERAWDMLGRLGIDGSYIIKNLSKGMKEKVQLVMVMARQAKLYLLDEPISGVDPAAREYILRTVISGYAPGSSVLISTHLISDIEEHMDGFIIIKKGKVFSEGTVDGLRRATGKSVDEYFREVFKC